MGDVLKPGGMSTSSGAAHSAAALPVGGTGGVGGMQQPMTGTAAIQQHPSKVLTGDLDSSLASLAENLTINKSASAQVK